MAVKYLSSELVIVHGYAAQPIRVTESAWLTLTRRAIDLFEQALGKPANPSSARATNWLRACGVNNQDSFFGLKSRLALLAQPADPSRIIRCRKCSAVLTDPISKALGIGPTCRTNGKPAS